jgi:hypothetical protein
MEKGPKPACMVTARVTIPVALSKTNVTATLAKSSLSVSWYSYAPVTKPLKVYSGWSQGSTALDVVAQVEFECKT